MNNVVREWAMNLKIVDQQSSFRVMLQRGSTLYSVALSMYSFRRMLLRSMMSKSPKMKKVTIKIVINGSSISSRNYTFDTSIKRRK